MNIIAQNILKKYGKFQLDLPDLKINSEDIFGLVVYNGTSKKHYLKDLFDLIEYEEGKVLF